MNNVDVNVPFSQLLHLIEKLKHLNIQPTDRISFEFIISFLFPSVWTNIQKFGTDCYMKGFLEGQKFNEN